MVDIEYFIKRLQEINVDEGRLNSDGKKIVNEFQSEINKSHFRRKNYYADIVEKVKKDFEDAASVFGDKEDILKLKRIKKRLVGFAVQILEENKRVFVVHGRDISIRDKVEALLGKLRIENVILENETNEGATIIEKFLKKSSSCHFAVVLLSADDVGGLAVGKTMQRFRARQNVVLELGYFLGRLGRKKIIVLHPDEVDIEKPSDFDGVLYLPYDNKGAWKFKLTKELKVAGFYIDDADADRV